VLIGELKYDPVESVDSMGALGQPSLMLDPLISDLIPFRNANISIASVATAGISAILREYGQTTRLFV
jgi:hypothetical protein